MGAFIVTSEEDLRRILKEILRDEIGQAIGQQKCVRGPTEDVLFTRVEMAKFLRISLVTLTDWTRRGLPVHRKRRRGRVLFIKEEVIEWLKDNPGLEFNLPIRKIRELDNRGTCQ